MACNKALTFGNLVYTPALQGVYIDWPHRNPVKRVDDKPSIQDNILDVDKTQYEIFNKFVKYLQKLHSFDLNLFKAFSILYMPLGTLNQNPDIMYLCIDKGIKNEKLQQMLQLILMSVHTVPFTLRPNIDPKHFPEFYANRARFNLPRQQQQQQQQQPPPITSAQLMAAFEGFARNPNQEGAAANSNVTTSVEQPVVTTVSTNVSEKVPPPPPLPSPPLERLNRDDIIAMALKDSDFVDNFLTPKRRNRGGDGKDNNDYTDEEDDNDYNEFLNATTSTPRTVVSNKNRKRQRFERDSPPPVVDADDSEVSSFTDDKDDMDSDWDDDDDDDDNNAAMDHSDDGEDDTGNASELNLLKSFERTTRIVAQNADESIPPTASSIGSSVIRYFRKMNVMANKYAEPIIGYFSSPSEAGRQNVFRVFAEMKAENPSLSEILIRRIADELRAMPTLNDAGTSQLFVENLMVQTRSGCIDSTLKMYLLVVENILVPRV